MVTLLHFEDDYDYANAIGRALESAGYRVVHVAAPPDDAVRYVLEMSPAVIVSDVLMPNYDGFTLARLLKADKRTRHIPLVFLTSLGSEADRRQAAALDAAAYLVKYESNSDELLRTLQTIIQS